MLTRLNHVRINVSDVNKALQGHEEVLGFEHDSGWPPENPTYYDFKSKECATFAILEVKGSIPIHIKHIND